MTKQTKSRGFTIVELLIVIVVIAILAAITIVAYNGIQNRAKTSAGQSLANTVAKKAEAYNTIQSVYPTRDELANNYDPGTTTVSTKAPEAKLDNSTAVVSGLVDGTTASNGNKVGYYKCATSGNGAIVVYWDYAAAVAKGIRVGTTTITPGTATLDNLTGITGC